MIKHFADKIVDAANTMAAGGTYGCVNDYDAYQPDLEDARETDPNILAVLNAAKDPKLNPPKKLRYGWRNLKKFYEKAGGFGPEKWKDRATLEGVMLNGKKIPQPGTPGSTGIDWCGVFATYCWIEAGVPGVRWGWPDQIATAANSDTVLHRLSAHHVLERIDYPSVAFRFQHRQFQEFYAARFLANAVADLLQRSEDAANRSFAASYLNKQMWEEPLRMVAEEIRLRSEDGATKQAAIDTGVRIITQALWLIRSSRAICPAFADLSYGTRCAARLEGAAKPQHFAGRIKDLAVLLAVLDGRDSADFRRSPRNSFWASNSWNGLPVSGSRRISAMKA